MSVAAAVERDLAELAARKPELALGALAATCRVLAAELDRDGNSATSKSLCARALRDAFDRLWELAPPAVEDDAVDDLAARRASRFAGGAAS